MGAFVGAVEAGAHAIETDIHLSSDGVVVLSHVSPGCHGVAGPLGGRNPILRQRRTPLWNGVLARKTR